MLLHVPIVLESNNKRGIWLFTAIQSGFQSFSLFQDGAIQILVLSGCFRTAGPVFQDKLSVVQDGSG